MTPMKISVIIPTYNRQATIDRAVQSVLQQTHPADELIVVDDGSTDNTASQLSAYPNLHYIYQANAGVSAARNRGIRAASGDWIALLDSDDEWLPEKLQQQINMLKLQPHYRFCHCDEIWMRHDVRVNPKHRHRKHGGHIYTHCLPLCVISPSAALIRRDVFDDTGWFDESLPACEDYDYWLRFCAVAPVLYVAAPLLKKYGGHADQLSRKFWGMDRYRLTALAKMICSDTLNQRQLHQTQAMLAEKLSIVVTGARKRDRHHDADTLERRFRRLTALQIPACTEEVSLSWRT